VGKGPVSATYDDRDGYVYVPNSMSGNVSVISGTTLTGTVDCGSSPDSATYDSANGYVYVPDSISAQVTVIDGLKVVGTVKVGAGPQYGSYDSRNGYLYVPSSGSNNVSVINGTMIVGSVDVGDSPQIATYDNGDGFVYVPNAGSDNVSVINGTKLVGTVNVGTGPQYAAYDPGNGFIYVANSLSFNVSVINGTTVVSTITVGAQPDSVSYDEGNGFVYVANHGIPLVTVLNGTSIVKAVSVAGVPWSSTYDLGNGYIYVANSNLNSHPVSGSGNVSVLNGTSVLGSASVGYDPEYSAYDSGNGYVYVPNFGSNNVSVLIISYEVGFTEVGLPADAGWWVNVTGGSSTSSTASTLYFNESHGSYVYSISTTAKNYSSPGGSFDLAGTPISVQAPFSLIMYVMNFTETGLPAGTNWSVTIGGVTRASTTSTILCLEPNGTHGYAVGAIPGWRAGSYAGTITVRGGMIDTTISWIRAAYSITFEEGGLPASTEWWVNVSSGVSMNSSGATLLVAEPNGSYAYSVASVDKDYSSQGGSFSVDGLNASETVRFTLVNYTVTFTEGGLPSDTGWWVNVTGGPSTFSTTEFLSFGESNGTYSYSVSATNANYSSPGGLLVVEGAAVSKVLAFSVTSFPVTFTESGLPSGTSWSVAFRGASASGTENLVFWGVPNGTFAFMIGSVSGYTANRTTGEVQVRGAAASLPITFAPAGPSMSTTSPATFLGLPAMEGYGVLGGAIIAILIVVMVVIMLRRSGGKTPSRPDAGEPPGSP
jgi:YVTN family beta-propeller protein